METWEIKGYIVEYIDETHQYLVDGICVPSITQILKIKFGNKYNNVNNNVLKNASEKGTQVHEAIEKLCKTGEVEELKEVKNFMFLQKHYKFEVIDNEVPVILFKNDKPIACGRLDLVLKIDDLIGGGDIKRTSVLDKEYLVYQLNLYRIAYKQCYDIDWKFLKGLHLREDVRKFVDIPINEEMAWNLVEKYLEKEVF
jgi:hypothetical protein|nr:MAG TPA: Mitochondrial genome maintenance exonuclease 1, DNA complex, DNA exonuclease [Caudoviricetes sp.]